MVIIATGDDRGTTREHRRFGTRLRETRIRAGMTQADLADRSGCSKPRISRYENGHIEPSIETLKRLADALGVSEAVLLSDGMTPKEEFLDILVARGVVLRSSADAQVIGDISAEIARALGMIVEGSFATS